MGRLRFLTAGESHGIGLTGILEGMPAGLPLSEEEVNYDLERRQGGYGRGGRMKIEKDRIEFRSGVRWGETLGGPITLWVANDDWVNWRTKMSPRAEDRDPAIVVSRPRPGHADLAGVLKYDREDIRDILERSSARETTVRVAIGAVCRKFLAAFGIDILSHVIRLGEITAPSAPMDVNLAEWRARVEASPVRCAEPEASERMVKHIDEVVREKDTLGGILEVIVTGLPMGLGSHVQWDRKLDSRIAAAVLSVQAMKGVEFGIGFAATAQRGSKTHDEIAYEQGRFRRLTNNAGGLEGGMTDGMPLVVRVAKKPISTVRKGLQSVDLKTREAAQSTYQRSDVTAVPAAGVILEAVIAFVLADAMIEKFGGDSLRETKRNFDQYLEQLKTARAFEGAPTGEGQDAF
ncbi:MAG: Chorismate synthase [bacterium]|nr:Chorismate synthase [bacterium]